MTFLTFWQNREVEMKMNEHAPGWCWTFSGLQQMLSQICFWRVTFLYVFTFEVRLRRKITPQIGDIFHLCSKFLMKNTLRMFVRMYACLLSVHLYVRVHLFKLTYSIFMFSFVKCKFEWYACTATRWCNVYLWWCMPSRQQTDRSREKKYLTNN